MRPVIVFCTDGGARMGLGHLRRCMTLGSELKRRGAATYFVVSQEPGSLGVLSKYGFEGVVVDEKKAYGLDRTLELVQMWGAHALVFDSYAVPGELLGEIQGRAVAVIDDLADRPLPVDLVINGAANARELAYRTLPVTRLLLGPEYILLREEFSQVPDRRIRRRVERILITVGGADHWTLTSRLIAWTRMALGPVDMDVVVGPFFTQECVRQIEQDVKDDRSVMLRRDPSEIRDLMLACDMAIVGGGQTTYELAATGTPAVALRLADNQTGNLSGLSAKGTLAWVGDIHDGDLREKAVEALVGLAGRKDRREDMSRSGRLVVDGFGVRRVAHAILEVCA